MSNRAIGLGIAVAVGLACGGCSFQRVYLSVEPEPFEGHFVRACELLETDATTGTSAPAHAIKPQPETMAALAAIRPPGRFCFVCRRLRICAAHLRSLGLTDPGARSVARAALRGRPTPGGQEQLPPPGGPGLGAVQERICRACASMPRRIQDGTWSHRAPGATER